MRLRLADAGVRAHGGADEEGLGREREQRLVEGGVVGRADEACPDVELGRADEVGVADVDGADDARPPRRR